VVGPGYALDHCGNDIVVSCPASVDILAMVRELRTKLRGGADCGDPCQDDDKPEGPKALRKKQGTKDRVYCLYLRYAEEDAEPVAPYTTDEACADTGCQPTRVKEGYRFELRCSSGGDRPDDVLSHALACIGEFIHSESSFAATRAITLQAQRLRVAHKLIDFYTQRHYAPISRGDAYYDRLGSLRNQLENALNNDRNDAERVVEAYRDLATQTARWYMQLELHRDYLKSHQSALQARVDEVAHVLAARGDEVKQIARDGLDTHLDKEVVVELVALTRVWVPLDEKNRRSTDMYQSSHEALLFVAGAPHSPRLSGLFAEAMRDLRRELLDKIAGSPRSHCDLVEKIDGMVLPGGLGNELRRSDVDSLLAGVDRLSESILRYFQECFCAALAPSCPAGEDPGVLLASLRVDECQVTNICNLGKKWLLSAANLRYWLGPLRLVGKLLESVCSEPLCQPRPLPDPQVENDPIPDDNPYPNDPSFAVRRVMSSAAPAPAAAPLAYGKPGLLDLLFDPNFSSDDLPDLILGELAADYLRPGQDRLRFADFARVAEQLGRMLVARGGGGSRKRTDTRVGSKEGEIIEILANEHVKRAVADIAVGALVKSVEDKRLNLGGAVEKSAEVTLERLRAERGEAVRSELRSWATSEEGLARSVRPTVEAVVGKHLPELELRQREDLERVVRNSGLDTSSMTQRIGAAVDSKVAALGLNRESLDSRISSTVQGTLAANGLVSEALGRRFEDAVRQRLDSEGFERESLDRRLGLAVRNTLASEGFTATALGERIHAEVAQSFAREGLTGKTLEERLDGRIRASIQPLLEVELKRFAAGGSAAALERVDTLTKELETLRTAHAALAKRLAPAADDDGDDDDGPVAPKPRKKAR
jgi:hypothetical protein